MKVEKQNTFRKDKLEVEWLVERERRVKSVEKLDKKGSEILEREVEWAIKEEGGVMKCIEKACQKAKRK